MIKQLNFRKFPRTLSVIDDIKKGWFYGLIRFMLFANKKASKS